MEIRHVPAFDYRWLLGQRKSGRAPSEKSKSGGLAQGVIKWINTFPFSILVGEGGLIYFILLLIRGQRLIHNEKITHLYSSFRPFADHYAAYWLKKWNPSVFWIADFRDLIIDPHYGHIFFPKAHERFFKKLFHRADLLTTVSEGLSVKLKSLNDHVQVLRNGVPDDAQPPVPVPCFHFTICYTGSMFLDKRNARPLFEALTLILRQDPDVIDNIRIVHAGKDRSAWQAMAGEYNLSYILMDQGLLPQVQARAIQQQACINLLLTISSPALHGVLTGKMIEYMEAGSPVLGIVAGQNDPELSAIFSEVEIGQSFSDQPADLENIKNFILREYHEWQKAGMNRKPVRWEVVEDKYAMNKIIKSLMYEL